MNSLKHEIVEELKITNTRRRPRAGLNPRPANGGDEPHPTIPAGDPAAWITAVLEYGATLPPKPAKK